MAIKTGTTPTHTITTDVDLTNAEQIYITYNQNTYKVIEKTKVDLVEITSNYVKVKLSQEETLRFKEKGIIKIDIKAKFADGSVIGSNTMETTAKRLLKEGII